jgi:RNA polymerase sigma-70 factor (ECF subfamily)
LGWTLCAATDTFTDAHARPIRYRAGPCSPRDGRTHPDQQCPTRQPAARNPFAEVAEIVGRTPAACRQLATSARRRIRDAQPPPVPTTQQAEIVKDFKQAWEAKDIDALVGLLDPDATAIADSGGLVAAHLLPIEGSEQIARTYVDIAGKAPNLRILERTVNGQPGLVAELDGAIVTVYAFDVADGRIKRIWAIRNPEKLRTWTTG